MFFSPYLFTLNQLLCELIFLIDHRDQLLHQPVYLTFLLLRPFVISKLHINQRNLPINFTQCFHIYSIQSPKKLAPTIDSEQVAEL